jgi:preprotein translocase subunit YajC
VLGSLVPLAQGSSGSSGSPLGSLVFLIPMIAVFYFILIRPNQRRQRAQKDLIQSLDVNDEVVTVGGIYGTITRLDEDGVMLEVAPNVEIHVIRSAIARKLVFDDEEYEEESDKQDEEAGDQS